MATKPLYKKYTLSRNVIAIQANITDAMRELGRSIESKEKDGFIVYFDDGTKDWCPKSEFEIYYKPSGSFYERLAIELEQIKRETDETQQLHDVASVSPTFRRGAKYVRPSVHHHARLPRCCSR